MPKLQKGTQEAKDYMKVIREQRTTKKKIDYETDSGEKTQKNIIIDLDKKTQKDEHGNVYETTTKIQTVDKPEKQKKTKKQKKQKDNLGNNEIIEDVVIDAEPEPEPEPEPQQPQQKKRGRKSNTELTAEQKKQKKRYQTDISNYNKRIERGEPITAHRQEIYNNAVKELSKMSGKGLLQDISSGIKKVGKKVKSAVKSAVKSVEEYGKAVIYGREDYPPKVRTILKEYGNEIIRSLTIMRTPVPKVLTGALSLFSGGEFGKRLEREFDELFHLFLEIETESGKRLSVEKNEVINIDINPIKRDKTEIKNVSNIQSGLSINTMLDKTESFMGQKKYFSYSARDNNCQDFIVSIFKANDIGDQSDITFIKQDTKQLFKDLPYLRKLSNTLTDLGSRVNVITTGAGLSQENYMVQSIIFSTDKWTTQKAKKWLKENDYKVPTVDKKEEHLRFRQSEPNKIESKGFTEYRTIPLGEDSGISLILAYKKNKISQKDITKMPRTKKIKGEGAIPTQVLVEREVLGKPHLYGGSICISCHKEMEEEPCCEMKGGKIDIGKAFKKLGSTIKKGFTKDIIKPAEKVGDYITAKKGGLASDVEKYGIPAVASATLGGLATLATGGNPVAGVAASALGSKLGSMGAAELEKATGTGVMKRKGRFEKGSQEAKDHMKMIREKKGKK